MSCRPLVYRYAVITRYISGSIHVRTQIVVYRGDGGSLVMNSFPDTIIRMVVAFVAGELHPGRDELFPESRRTPRQLVPLSRRFVPEPVQMTYIFTDLMIGRSAMGQAACIPSAIAEFIRATPWASQHVRKAGIDGDERIRSICVYGAAEVHPVPQVTLQTRLRRPFWPNTSAFREFIDGSWEIVYMYVCRNCRSRCNMSVRPPIGSIERGRCLRMPARPS